MKPDKKNENNYSEQELKEWEKWAEEWVEDLKEQLEKRQRIVFAAIFTGQTGEDLVRDLGENAGASK